EEIVGRISLAKLDGEVIATPAKCSLLFLGGLGDGRIKSGRDGPLAGELPEDLRPVRASLDQHGVHHPRGRGDAQYTIGILRMLAHCWLVSSSRGKQPYVRSCCRRRLLFA